MAEALILLFISLTSWMLGYRSGKEDGFKKGVRHIKWDIENRAMIEKAQEEVPQ